MQPSTTRPVLRLCCTPHTLGLLLIGPFLVMYAFIHAHNYALLCLSVARSSIRLSIHPSIHPSIHLSIHISIHLSMSSLSIYCLALCSCSAGSLYFLSKKKCVACEQVRQKLLNTRKRMEDTLAGVTPDDDEEWYDTAEALAQPLLACYWSLWECGQPPCSSSSQPLPISTLISAFLQADLCPSLCHFQPFFQSQFLPFVYQLLPSPSQVYVLSCASICPSSSWFLLLTSHGGIILCF